jgi:hypothetical protein
MRCCGGSSPVVSVSSSLGSALVGAQERTQLGRDRDGDVEIWDRQHLGLAIGKPIFGLVGVAFGAGAVFAGVIREHLVGAMITAPEMSAESLGSAREDIGDGTAMRRRHRHAMGPHIVIGEPTEDVGDLDHRRQPPSEVGHQRVEEAFKRSTGRLG